MGFADASWTARLAVLNRLLSACFSAAGGCAILRRYGSGVANDFQDQFQKTAQA